MEPLHAWLLQSPTDAIRVFSLLDHSWLPDMELRNRSINTTGYRLKISAYTMELWKSYCLEIATIESRPCRFIFGNISVSGIIGIKNNDGKADTLIRHSNYYMSGKMSYIWWNSLRIIEFVDELFNLWFYKISLIRKSFLVVIRNKKCVLFLSRAYHVSCSVKLSGRIGWIKGRLYVY